MENRYTYTDFNELKINWKYGEEQGVSFASIAPGQLGRIQIPIETPDKANELYLSFTDPRGFIADEYIIPVGKQVQNELPELLPVATQLKKRADKYYITGKNFTCEVSRTTGQVLSLKRGKQEILNGGPWLMALPLNGGGCYPNHNANTPLFNDICTEWNVVEIDAKK